VSYHKNISVALFCSVTVCSIDAAFLAGKRSAAAAINAAGPAQHLLRLFIGRFAPPCKRHFVRRHGYSI
jgi:hypothetical protein